MTEGQLISKRRKDMAAWAVENFKTWPKPHEITDADQEEIGCELVVLNQHHLPVLRCKLGGGYVDSTTWFYAKRNPKMTQTQQPEALRLADALIEAVDAWFADNTGLGGCSDKDVAELAAIFATQQAAQGLDAQTIKHISALSELVRMPNAEHFADAHNAAVRHLRAIAAQAKKGEQP